MSSESNIASDEIKQSAQEMALSAKRMKQNITDKFKNMKQLQNAYKRLEEEREKLLGLIGDNLGLFIMILGTSIMSIIYFVFIHKRVSKSLNKMKQYKIQPSSIKYNREAVVKNFKLCDFYVASSYKSYLPCTNYYDYASIESVKQVLISGARYIDLDIFNKDFKQNTEPVICEGDEVGNWQYTTAISFDKTCEMISTTAFNGALLNNSEDPLFINLNFKTWENKDTINKCAKILIKYFYNKLLSTVRPEYAWQGRFVTNSKQSLSQIPIKTLINGDNPLIVIITKGDISDTDMDEISNFNPDKNDNFRDLTHIEVKDNYDIKELTEFNKLRITRVTPKFYKRTKENYKFFTPYFLGCQFICMNYTKTDEFMRLYAKKFKKCSFILKPEKLRYKPILISAPKKQSSKVSSVPKRVNLGNGAVVTV